MKSKVGAKAYRSIGGNIGTFIFLLIIALFMLLPLVFVVSSAFKPLSELFIFPPKLFPMNPTLDNFKDLSSLLGDSWLPFSRYVFNSLAVTVIGTFGNIIFSSMAAYVLSKHDFPGKNILFQTVVLSLLFSTLVTGIPNYIIITKLHMINTVWALILPLLPSSLGLFLMKQFMDQTVNLSVLESADIDGAGEFVKFFKLVMPMAKPAWITLMIFTVQSLWGLGSSSYIFSEQFKTLSYALSQVQAAGIARAGVGGAITVLMMLVPLAVFIVSQSNVTETMSTSGMKD